jgi:hypothetical protein
LLQPVTRSEIFAAAWRRFRSVHGAKATPRRHPHYWAACLRMMWQAAKGDAFFLCAIRDDAREAAREQAIAKRGPRNWSNASRAGRTFSRSRSELAMLRNFAA